MAPCHCVSIIGLLRNDLHDKLHDYPLFAKLAINSITCHKVSTFSNYRLTSNYFHVSIIERTDKIACVRVGRRPSNQCDIMSLAGRGHCFCMLLMN